jgi:hypothetical protein
MLASSRFRVAATGLSFSSGGPVDRVPPGPWIVLFASSAVTDHGTVPHIGTGVNALGRLPDELEDFCDTSLTV